MWLMGLDLCVGQDRRRKRKVRGDLQSEEREEEEEAEWSRLLHHHKDLLHFNFFPFYGSHTYIIHIIYMYMHVHMRTNCFCFFTITFGLSSLSHSLSYDRFFSLTTNMFFLPFFLPMKVKQNCQKQLILCFYLGKYHIKRLKMYKDDQEH